MNGHMILFTSCRACPFAIVALDRLIFYERGDGLMEFLKEDEVIKFYPYKEFLLTERFICIQSMQADFLK